MSLIWENEWFTEHLPWVHSCGRHWDHITKVRNEWTVTLGRLLQVCKTSVQFRAVGEYWIGDTEVHQSLLNTSWTPDALTCISSLHAMNAHYVSSNTLSTLYTQIHSILEPYQVHIPFFFFYRQGNWHFKRLSILSKTTQLVTGTSRLKSKPILKPVFIVTTPCGFYSGVFNQFPPSHVIHNP